MAFPLAESGEKSWLLVLEAFRIVYVLGELAFPRRTRTVLRWEKVHYFLHIPSAWAWEDFAS